MSTAVTAYITTGVVVGILVLVGKYEPIIYALEDLEYAAYIESTSVKSGFDSPPPPLFTLTSSICFT